MSWLIALALFWWIGSSIAKGIDKANGLRVHHNLAIADQQMIFRHRLYVVAWPYYQELEKQAIKEWEDHGFANQPFATRDVFESFQAEIFGAPIEEIAFRRAFDYLRDHGFPLYRPNPARTSNSLMHERYIPADSTSYIDFAELRREVHEDIFNIPNLDVFYYSYYSEDIQADELLKFVPPVTMPEVGYYKFNGRSYRRERFPHDYDERCRLYRIRHPDEHTPTIETFLDIALRHRDQDRMTADLEGVDHIKAKFVDALKNTNEADEIADLSLDTNPEGELRQCPCCLKVHKTLTVRTQDKVFLYCPETNSYYDE